ILLNVMAIHAIFSRGILKKYQFQSSMYILYLQPLLTDLLSLLIFICYSAPMVMTQNYLFRYPMHITISIVMDSLNNYCWFNSSLSHISLALNRFVATILFRSNLLTFNVTASLAAFQHLLAISMMAVSQFGLPCCRIEFDYSIYSYRDAMIPGRINTAWFYLKLPAQIACSAIPFIIYCIFTVRSTKGRLVLKSEVLRKRRRQELKFTAQFAGLAALYTATWTAFFLFPAIKFTPRIPGCMGKDFY
ncbi:hypothetical protein PFISCL1PPCAC_17470, partial [Pristionchus fissidentatus]